MTGLSFIEERREVIWGLLQLKHIPVGMELFPASASDVWSVIERVIDESDYYVVLVDESGVSFTEREFDYAVISPCLPVIEARRQRALNPNS